MGGLLLLVVVWLTRFEDWRSYSPVVGGDGAVEAPGEQAHREKPGGLTRWLTTVDHRDIGLLYGTFAVLSFAWGGVAVLLMRLELVAPASDFLEPSLYNAFLTSHGITMLFLFGTPMLAAFSNYLVPLLVGADDM
ncbi:MAG: cbb3-type cytochrome c oxidase subunit I, partial [Halorientalis sp.]